MARPLVSCIVPVLNGEEFLAEALDSIFGQTYQPVEVIVVDDGSSDGTADLARSYGDRLTYVYQDNGGEQIARNHGLSVARGEFIAFLDADDLWERDKLSRQMACFEATPELEICNVHMRNIWSDEVKEEADRAENEHLARPQVAVAQGLLVRRRTFDRIGPFDPDLRHRSVLDWLARARDLGAVIEVLPDVLVRRRIHRDNLSRRRDNVDSDDFIKIIKASLERRRRQQ